MRNYRSGKKNASKEERNDCHENVSDQKQYLEQCSNIGSGKLHEQEWAKSATTVKSMKLKWH